MSRTLNQLDLGTSVYLEENGTPKEYILMKKDVDGCILLRAKALEARRMNATNVTNYEGSEMDDWLIDEETGFMSRFDTATKAAIVSRSRPTFDYGDTSCRYISRRAFLLTNGELFLSTPTALEPLTGLTPALMIWKGTSDANTGRIAKNEADQAVSWWLSSPYSATGFCNVNSNGTSNYNGASNSNNWARPALNVSAETIVSDEGAETIYLMPDPNKDYREISFTTEIATSGMRPYQINLQYDTSNLYDVAVYVCNNYGDASPVWVPCTSGVTVNLSNTVKDTANWRIGVKFYGKSQGLGWVDEPIIKWLEVA